MNDPLEGQVIDVRACSYAGCSMSVAADDEDMVAQGIRNQFKILSLSSKYDSAQLWAHYADNYEGICLCFSTSGTFSSARPIEYNTERETKYSQSGEGLERPLKEAFIKRLRIGNMKMNGD